MQQRNARNWCRCFCLLGSTIFWGTPPHSRGLIVCCRPTRGSLGSSTSLCVRGSSIGSYAQWEWHPRVPACGQSLVYNPTRAVLPPTVSTRVVLCGQACLTTALPPIRAHMWTESASSHLHVYCSTRCAGTADLVPRSRRHGSLSGELDHAYRVRSFPPSGTGHTARWVPALSEPTSSVVHDKEYA